MKVEEYTMEALKNTQIFKEAVNTMSKYLSNDHTAENRFPLGKDGTSEIVDYLEKFLNKEQIKNAYYRVSVKAKIKQNNKILLVREDGKKWDLPGGGIEHSETIEQALERELKEEVGLFNFKIDTPPKIFKMIDKSANQPLLFIVFEFTIEDSTLILHSWQSPFGNYSIKYSII